MFPLGTVSNVGSGIKGLIGGLLTGAALLLVATLVLFWNEGRAVKRAAVLEQGRTEVQAADAASVNSGNEGKLVHVRGELAVDGRLRDPDFAIESDGIALRRRVEMYQWEEKKSRKSGNSNEYVYSYSASWEDRLVDHTRFDQPSGHENPPSMPFPAASWRADEVRLGAFRLGDEAISELSNWESVRVDASLLPPNLAASLREEGGVLTSAASLNSPKVGDVRIRFDQVPLGRASVIAQQQQGQLQSFTAKQGELLLAERGSVSAEAMFDGAETRNSQLGWALRVGGFFAFWIGFGLMLRPVSGVLGSLPIIGGIGRMVTSVVAGLLALMLSLLTIVSGWLFYRPWLLGVLLLALVAGVVWLARRPRAVAAVRMPPPASGPPPPPPAA